MGIGSGGGGGGVASFLACAGLWRFPPNTTELSFLRICVPGCTASNNYNGLDLDNHPTIEARRQNVEFPCPCGTGFCLHGGTCVSAVPPFCICPPGWTGGRCEDIVKEPSPG